jgi:hypothetical protein
LEELGDSAPDESEEAETERHAEMKAQRQKRREAEADESEIYESERPHKKPRGSLEIEKAEILISLRVKYRAADATNLLSHEIMHHLNGIPPDSTILGVLQQWKNENDIQTPINQMSATFDSRPLSMEKSLAYYSIDGTENNDTITVTESSEETVAKLRAGKSRHEDGSRSSGVDRDSRGSLHSQKSSPGDTTELGTPGGRSQSPRYQGRPQAAPGTTNPQVVEAGLSTSSIEEEIPDVADQYIQPPWMDTETLQVQQAYQEIVEREERLREEERTRRAAGSSSPVYVFDVVLIRASGDKAVRQFSAHAQESLDWLQGEISSHPFCGIPAENLRVYLHGRHLFLGSRTLQENGFTDGCLVEVEEME